MTVMMTDIHDSEEAREAIKQGYMSGVDLSEVLYADDVVIFSESETAISALLHAIDREGDLHEVTINKSKHDVLFCAITPRNIHVSDGARLKKKSEVGQ